jgi:hypothetical protein
MPSAFLLVRGPPTVTSNPQVARSSRAGGAIRRNGSSDLRPCLRKRVARCVAGCPISVLALTSHIGWPRVSGFNGRSDEGDGRSRSLLRHVCKRCGGPLQTTSLEGGGGVPRRRDQCRDVGRNVEPLSKMAEVLMNVAKSTSSRVPPLFRQFSRNVPGATKTGSPPKSRVPLMCTLRPSHPKNGPSANWTSPFIR